MTDSERPPWDEPGPERRQGDRRSSTLSLVEQAAEIAAQNVAAIHRRRLALWCFLGGLLAALMIAIPTALWEGHLTRKASVENARYNCDLLTNASGVLADFIKSDARLRKDQAGVILKRAALLKQLNALFGNKTYSSLQKESSRLDTHAQAYWNFTLVPRLRNLATVNCNKTLTSGGVVTTANKASIKTITLPTRLVPSTP